MSAPMNPWLRRFDDITDDEAIRTGTTVGAQHLLELSQLDTAHASQKLEIEFERIYVPTRQARTLIASILGLAKATSEIRYPSVEHFLSHCYDRDTPPLPNATPVAALCLTGLAGVGKSQLLTAIDRLISQRTRLDIDAGHVGMPDRPIERLVISKTSTEGALLQALSSPGHAVKTGKGSNLPSLRAHVKGYRFRIGTSVLILDEMQFLTQSATASTLVAKTLTAMMALEMPIIFAANYSMIRRLFKRPSEERQRFLARPLGLAPEAADSPDWLAIVSEYLKASPEFFPNELLEDLQELHDLTSGIPRALKRLLVSAFELSHARTRQRHVAISDIRKAYTSHRYSSHREEIEALSELAINPSASRKHPDLSCPFEGLFIAEDMERAQRARAERDRRVSTKVLEGSLNAAERRALDEVRRAAKRAAKRAGPSIDTDRTVVPLRQRTRVTPESLAEGSRALAKRLGKDAPETQPNPGAPEQDRFDV